jgi:hypothetical protein
MMVQYSGNLFMGHHFFTFNFFPTLLISNNKVSTSRSQMCVLPHGRLFVVEF